MMLRQIIALLLLFTVISYSNGNEIKPEERKVKAYLFNPVTLNCKHSSKVAWLYGEDEYLYSYIDCIEDYPHTTSNELFKNISSNCTRSEKTTFLTLSFITKKYDNMTIICQKYKYPDIHFVINVVDEPTVEVSNVNVKVGQQATLKCIVIDLEHFQIVSLKWTQELFGQQIERHVSNQSRLIFPKTSWSDTGNWTCSVTIKNDQKTMMIEGSGILSATGVPILDQIKDVIETEESESKTIRTFIYSYSQKIRVKWYHNNVRIFGKIILSPSNRQSNLSNNTVHLPGYVTQLTLEDIKQKDAGYYTLYVYNDEGVSNATFTLRIKTSEKINAILIIGITGGSILLILIVIIVMFIVCFSVKKISSDAASDNYTSITTRSTSIKYIKDFNKDEFLSDKDEPIYAEIGYIDMNRAKELKATQNEYLNPKSVNSLRRICNEEANAHKATPNEYLNPRSVNSLRRICNEAPIN